MCKERGEQQCTDDGTNILPSADDVKYIIGIIDVGITSSCTQHKDGYVVRTADSNVCSPKNSSSFI